MENSSVPQMDFEAGFYNTIAGALRCTKITRHGINPATEQPNPEVPVAARLDVENAVQAARSAFGTWSKQPWAERRAAVHSFADAIEHYQEEFATLLTKEQGKPIQFAREEVKAGVRWLRELSDLELKDETLVAGNENGKNTIVRYTPLGVVAGIVPWNFPIHLACGKIAPSLVTGNTIIIKPSPFTPYCDLKLGELAQAFFPPGVLQVISGDDQLGPWLTSHPEIDKISFTGSTATGKAVMSSAAKTLKRITLELGGNDPAIICRNVNVEAVAKKVSKLAFFNSGQVCVAVKRVYVHEAIYGRFRDYFVRFTESIRSGEGQREDVFLGPVQNKMQYEKVNGFISDGIQAEWAFATGGRNSKRGAGYFITPTIVDRPPEEARIVREEPFGPIVPLMSWSSEQDVVRRANDTRMGLGASVWSNDLGEAEHIARQLEAGSVWINTHQEGDPRAPFGGHKESGLGYEWGLAGLKSYCNVQSLFLSTRIEV